MVKRRSVQSEQTADLEYSMACEHSPKDVPSASGRDDSERWVHTSTASCTCLGWLRNIIAGFLLLASGAESQKT